MLGHKHKLKSIISPSISASAKSSLEERHKLRILEASADTTKHKLDEVRKSHANSRRLFIRETRNNLAMSREKIDGDLHKIISNPAAAFHAFRSSGRSSTRVVKRMQVGSKVFSGENVADGLYDSMNTLKAPCMVNYNSLPPYTEAVET